MCSRIKSSFSGTISEIPGIAVDNFERLKLQSQAFFLSHCHSDHTQGLFSDELLSILSKNNIFIYTSEWTSAVIADDCKNIKNDRNLMKYVKPLSMGTTSVHLPEVFEHEELFLRVTLVPAGHCLGSVMFLFETTDKKILYTGDFNISSNDIRAFVPFHTRLKETIHLDAMYVDTTFMSVDYDYFPKRPEVVEKMIGHVRDWLKANPKNRISLNTSAKYGYEFIYENIHKNLGLKVYVNDERWRFYSKNSEFMEIMTNNRSEAKIHVCRDYSENGNHRYCNLETTDGLNFLFIRFSAMKWDGYEIGQSAINKISNNRLDVCFPTHCSRSEIINFVTFFLPNKVVGFPNDYCYSSPRKYDMNENVHDEVTPKKRKIDQSQSKSVKTKINKIDQKLLRKIFD